MESPSSSSPRRLCGSKRKSEEASIAAIITTTTRSPYFCETCHVSASSESALQDHFDGKSHKSRITKEEEEEEEEEEEKETEKKNILVNFMFSCDLCSVGFNSSGEMEDHLQGKVHKSMELFYCNLCDTHCNSQAVMDDHLNGKKHKSREAMRDGAAGGSSEKKEAEGERKGQWRCEVCEVWCNSEVVLAFHLKGKKHKKRKAEVCVAAVGGAGVLPKATEQDGGEEGNGVQGKESNCKAVVVGEKGEEEKEKKEEVNEREGGAEEKGKDEKKGFWCDICEVQCNSEAVMANHIHGKKHRAKSSNLEKKRKLMEDKEKEEMKLETSNADNNDCLLMTATKHEGEKGKDNAAMEETENGNGVKEEDVQEEEEKEVLWCLGCKMSFNSRAMMTKHLKGTEHKANQALRRGYPITSTE